MADTAVPVAAPTADKPQPTRKLPTDRIAFQKQLDIMRAYGLSSQSGTRVVNYREAAEVVKMSASTVALMNTFMIDAGFVERSGNDFIPARALIDFAQAYSWAPETASRKLGPAIRKTWFGERLLTRLAFRSITVDDAIADLAGLVSAGPEFKPQIETLVDFAVEAGLVKRDGNQLSLGEKSPDEIPLQTTQPQPEKTMADVRDDSPPRPARSVATGFMTTEGRVQFHVSIDVSMQEMSGWSPDRISAFFAGLAQVLAAKKGTEEIT